MSLYLYAVIPDPGEAAITVRGLRDTALSTIACDGIAMVVGPSVEERYVVRPDDTRAHYAALEALMADRPLLPVRYGTIAQTPEEVVDRVLRPRAEEFRRLLEWIADKEEIGVKAAWRQMDRVYEKIRTKNPKLLQFAARTGTGVSYVDRIEAGRWVRDALQEYRESVQRQIMGRLREVAVDVVERAPYGDEAVLHVAFLVAKANGEAWERRVGELRTELEDDPLIRLTRRCVPYNFIKIVIDLGSPCS